MCNHDNDHDHDWQPIPNWYARYRCSTCFVVGGKFGVICAKYGVRSMEIRPYRCDAHPGGMRCGKPAIHSNRGKKFRCAEHQHRARVARPRKELAEAKVAEAGAEETEKSTDALSRSSDAPERG